MNELRGAAGHGRASEVVEEPLAEDSRLPSPPGREDSPGASRPRPNGVPISSEAATTHSLAEVDELHNRAITLARQGHFEESLPLYRQVVQRRPDYPPRHTTTWASPWAG